MEKNVVEIASLDEKISTDSVKNIEYQGEILGYPKENVELVVKLAEEGLNSESIIGYHGTSLESLKEALLTGSLRGAMKSDSEVGMIVDPEHSFFFFPVKEKFANHPLADKFHTDAEGPENAEMYAHLLAGAHFLLRDLDIGITDKEAVEHAKSIIVWHDYAFSNEASESIKYFEEKGINKKELMKRAEEAAKHKGVVLGIRDSVKDVYDMRDPLQNEGDLSIQIPEGLSLKDVAGIEPLSQDGWDFFMELQSELRKGGIEN